MERDNVEYIDREDSDDEYDEVHFPHFVPSPKSHNFNLLVYLCRNQGKFLLYKILDLEFHARV